MREAKRKAESPPAAGPSSSSQKKPQTSSPRLSPLLDEYEDAYVQLLVMEHGFSRAQAEAEVEKIRKQKLEKVRKQKAASGGP
ncbi:MAG: hypothetical protein FJ333_01345 [Sphingomonadales bacterium]|nr:hypothetical protein [Sphingomonadales bacterium]